MIFIASGDRVRSFSVSPTALVLSGLVVFVFFAGYISSTAYLMMRDGLIGAGHARQARLVRHYEDRIATLRAQVDRVKSQQLVDQRNIEDNVKRLFARQQKLSLRHGQMEPLLERARLAGLMRDASPIPVPIPRPDPGTVDARDGIAAIERVTRTSPQAERKNGFASAYLSTGSIPVSPPVGFTAPRSGSADADDPARTVDAIASSLRDMESDQVQKVDLLTSRAVRTASAIRAVLMRSGLPDEIGTIASRLGARAASAPGGIGGPYIRLNDPAHFDASLTKLNGALDRLESIRSTARKLPFGEPLANDVMTSPFGARSDPFLGHAAFHPGVDLRAARGTDVHATGNGTVVFAGRDAGYGNMVEIDHGDGVHTRYGHLSHILVDKGQSVKAGEIIAESGSTGRSTGPHLHYEVRLNGQPVDPTRFLDSGRSLQAYLRG